MTPFRGFVREATRRNLDTKITVLYTVRTTDDIIFNEEFRELEKENPNFVNVYSPTEGDECFVAYDEEGDGVSIESCTGRCDRPAACPQSRRRALLALLPCNAHHH